MNPLASRFALLLTSTLIAPLGMAAPDAGSASDTAITIYSSQQPGAISPDFYRPLPGQVSPPAASVPGYAMVRQERSLSLNAGHNTLRFNDVAALIDPTTVTFSVPADPSITVSEQNFQFDLVSNQKLMLRYLDRPIIVERSNGNQTTQLSGTLLSASDGLVLRTTDGGVQAVRDYTSVRFPELPGGLITQPTLVWDINSERTSTPRARVTYQTGGITWWADYNLIYSDGKTAGTGVLDLSAWVSIINQSGASFTDAKLKLVAGDVHRAQPAASPRVMYAMKTDAAIAEGFAEKSFDEFHLYTLGRRTSLPNNSTKQIELFEHSQQIPARRTLIYHGGDTPDFGSPYTDRNAGISINNKVESWLEFRNDNASGLGIPLPAGRVRVSRIDNADGSLEFIGEDVIGHTPKDEDVRLHLGNAFDVVAERKQVNFNLDSKARWMEEEIEVTLRNHKSQPIEVRVEEPLYRWSQWRIVSSSLTYQKDSAQQAHFNVPVPKDGNTVLRYKVRYSW